MKRPKQSHRALKTTRLPRSLRSLVTTRQESRRDFLSSLFQDRAARYNFSTLLRVSQKSESELAGRLWEEVWQGHITNDTFLTLRRAIMNKFDPGRMVAENAKRLRHRVSRRRRLSFAEEKEGPSFVGNWHIVPKPELQDDPLETEERRKDRVRLLLDRYGILFRELLQKEWPALRWSAVFRALRIMELSGEVISGIFFNGIPGPQFISQNAFHRLQQRLPEDAIYWMNATDPASLCGLQVDSLRGMLPPRVASTHLVYRGKDLKVVSKRNGKDLSFFVPHDDPGSAQILYLPAPFIDKEVSAPEKDCHRDDQRRKSNREPLHSGFADCLLMSRSIRKRSSSFERRGESRSPGVSAITSGARVSIPPQLFCAIGGFTDHFPLRRSATSHPTAAARKTRQIR